MQDVAPRAVFAYVPAAQIAHDTVAEVFDQYPAGHGVQFTEPGPLYVPEEQGMHDVAPKAAFAYVPAVQLEHNLDKPVTLLKEPARHDLQLD
jgi:hypothetical protein